MAERQEQEKVNLAVNEEDEDDQQLPLEDPSADDPDWTPGRRGYPGVKQTLSDPGKFPYNLRNTIPKRLWSGEGYNTEPVERDSLKGKKFPPDTPSRIPGFETKSKRLFGFKEKNSDARPGAPTGGASGAPSSSETPNQAPLVGSPFPESYRAGGTGGGSNSQPGADSAQAQEAHTSPALGSTVDSTNTQETNTFPSLFSEMATSGDAAQAEGQSAPLAAVSAPDVFGNKDNWSDAVWGKWEESEKNALVEATPVLSDFLMRFLSTSESDIQKLGSAVSTYKAKIQKDLEGKTLVEKAPPDDLVQRIERLQQDYEKLWEDRTDIRKQLLLFQGNGMITLGLLGNIQDAIDVVHAIKPEALMAETSKVADSQYMPLYRTVKQFVSKWRNAFTLMNIDRVPIKQEPTDSETKPEANANSFVSTEYPSLNTFRLGLTQYNRNDGAGGGPSGRDNSVPQHGGSTGEGPSAAQPSQPPPDGGPPMASGSGGSGGPDRPMYCSLCFKPGHSAENCPGRPEEKKGPYCIKCKRMGHTFYECPHGRFAVPCNHCGDIGHFDKDCPVERARQRRVAQREPRTQQEVRLLRKAGIPLEEDDREDSDIEEIPREDPQTLLKRQMKERKRLEAERQVRKLKKEEEKQLGMQWAELYRMKEDLIMLLSGRDKATEYDLDQSQQKDLTQALINAYIQQQTKGTRALDQATTVAASLKDLGIDGLHQYDGNEAKYPVKSFIRQVDDVKGFKKWPNTTAAIAMAKLLVGNAKDWYEVLRAENQQETPEYNKLKLALLQQFYKKITIVEKALAMTALKFDVSKHGSHLNFLTECERQAFILSDQAYSLESDTELITRKQAREEQTLLIFVANSAPLLRYEIEYQGAETKEQIKAVIRKFENALRAKENSPRHALLPGYKVNEVTKPDPASVQRQMEALGYSANEVNAVVKTKGQKNGGDTVIQCYYCATIGHRRNECGLLEEDVRKNQVKPDKLGPRAGQAPQVESLAKKKASTKEKKPKGGAKPTGTKKKKVLFRKKKVNAVEVTDSEGDTDEAEEEQEEITDPRGSSKVAAPVQAPGVAWNPWGPYPGTPGWPPFGSTGRPALEAPQTAEVSASPRRKSVYDLI